METWLPTFGVIFAIIDPFGYVPIFLSLTAGDSEAQRRKMIRKACLTAFIVLTLSTFIGQQILSFFGISIPALQISGGLILLIIGFEMMKVLPVVEKLSQKEETESARKEDISIVPVYLKTKIEGNSISFMVTECSFKGSSTAISSLKPLIIKTFLLINFLG